MSVGSSKQTLCKLCLNIINDTDFEVIQEILREILQVVLPRLDLKIKDKHIICRTCHVKLITAFNFKSMCINTEDVIFSYTNPAQMPVVELKDVYLKKKGNVQLSISDNQIICRLCMQLIAYGFLSLNQVDVGIMVNYISEININATKDPVICELCFDSLLIHGSFVNNCLDVQGQYIQSYIQTEEIDSKAEECDQDSDSSSVNLFERTIRNNRRKEVLGDSGEIMDECFLKNCCDVQEQYTQSYIKTEEIDIKTDESDQDSDSSSHELFEEIIRNDKGKRVVGDSEETVNEYVRQCRARKVQILEHKSRVQKSETPFDVPSTKSENKNEFKLHKHKDLSEVPMYKCDECDFQSKHKRRLTLHKLKHEHVSIAQIYKYDTCETKNKGGLKPNRLTHKDSSEIQMYKCDACNYNAKYKSALKRHQLIHKEPFESQMYKCDSCSYKSKYKTHLKKHKLTHRVPSVIRMYKCDVCSFESKYRYSLKIHLLIHKNPSEIQMHKCDVCNYETKYKSDVKVHKLMHKDPSEIRMYKCDVCDYETKYKRSLRGHLLIHKDLSEVRVYKCDTCSYEFKRKDHLKEHQLTHKDPSEIQMYRCDMCSYETMYKHYLKRHLLNHKDLSEVPMCKCDMCSYECKRKSHLKAHQLTHKYCSESQTYKCDRCTYETKYKSDLKRHLFKCEEMC